MSFSKDEVKEIYEDMKKAMEQVEEKHGVNISPKGNVSYTENNFQMKFQVTANDGYSREEESYNKVAGAMGLPPLYSKIQFEKDTFITIGLNPRAKKYPVIVKCTKTGNKYKMSEKLVQNCMVLEEA